MARVTRDSFHIAGTNNNHPSGIAHHIRKAGIYDSVMERVELIAGLGVFEMTVWGYSGHRYDIWPGGKIRFDYQPHPDIGGEQWRRRFISACDDAYVELGVVVSLYMGKAGMVSPIEWARGLHTLTSIPSREVILDNMSEDTSDQGDSRDLDDAIAQERIAQLVERGYSIGSEFPERAANLADFGYAYDMTDNPRSGSPRGASLAHRDGLIPNGQPLWIVLGHGWPDQRERMAYWEEQNPGVKFAANLSSKENQDLVEEV